MGGRPGLCTARSAFLGRPDTLPQLKKWAERLRSYLRITPTNVRGLSETTSPLKRSRPHACQQPTSTSRICVSRFIIVFLVSTNDPAVTWTAWADSSFRTHCTDMSV
ncbi:hypothetical protein Y032_0094g2699 [Ancylostoma ceylanicum]|uniref:Uncharacterized protein n=1 Tax=Ancylostoma ceylanicum TaxID=53326 RepID=A0A016TL10_9BILA|nr:hypothetical protein Y032_0094g2699 [Ancylostoma ceylanicum]